MVDYDDRNITCRGIILMDLQLQQDYVKKIKGGCVCGCCWGWGCGM